jgi:uncharacterized Tic20 family protein
MLNWCSCVWIVVIFLLFGVGQLLMVIFNIVRIYDGIDFRIFSIVGNLF